MRRLHALAAPLLLALGCSSPDSTTPPADAGPVDSGTGDTGTLISFDLKADLAKQSGFYDLPYPSDLRLTAAGGPDLTGFPFAGTYEVFAGVRKVAMEQGRGFPVVPVAYFKVSADLPALDADQVIAADKASPILLIDVDETSSERGKLFPVVATTPPADVYVRVPLLAAAPRPGIVLHPKRKYAFVVQRSLKDAQGKDLGVPVALTDLAAGKTPEGEKGAQAKDLYASLWSALPLAGVDVKSVAGATVFTTGDVVAELADLSTKLAAKYTVTIDNLAVDPDDGAAHDGYCELIGKVTYPQFQKGKPPFDTDGLFEYSDGGLPAKQRDEIAPVTITLPKGPMPAGGYPLVVFFHGSGGASTAVVDRGTWHPESDPTKCPGGHQDEWLGVKGCNTKGEGPAWVVAPHGFAMVGSALPVNPERYENAPETAYLNFNNLAAGHDLFRQGVIEQRLLIDAMSKIQITPAMLGACTGSTLPAGETAFHFNVKEKLFAQGQSMGGQYTNLVSAVDPRIRASVPTGAGGYWSHFILITPLIPGVAEAVGNLVLGTKAKLTFMHPALSIFQTAWEAVDPMVYMPRLARRPLPGHPVRSIYEPVGKGDSYFPEATYDAMALAYGHKEAGSIVWPSMQDALKLEGLSGLEPYPASNNLTSEDGTKYTGVIVQYEGDGVYDPHALYSQREEVKYQYGCFLESFLKTGTAKVPAPAKLGTACP